MLIRLWPEAELGRQVDHLDAIVQLSSIPGGGLGCELTALLARCISSTHSPQDVTNLAKTKISYEGLAQLQRGCKGQPWRHRRQVCPTFRCAQTTDRGCR